MKFPSRIFAAVVAIFVVGAATPIDAATVTITLQDTNFPTQFNSGGDFFNQGTTELGMWANSGAKQTVAWKNFTTDGNNGGSARSLQVGDVFTITVAATRAFGQIGLSLNAGGTQGSSYANNISGSRMYITTDNFAAWSVKGLTNSGTASLTYAPLQNTYKDYRFTVKITSQSTADVFLTVDGTDYRANNLTLAGTAGANISAFSIFGSDMWDGDSSDNAYWKQTTTVSDSGSVQLGYYQTSGTYTAGLITDGLAANSTSTVRANLVEIGGDAGSAVILNQANTYTGGTTVNANATALVANNSALGSSGTATVTSGGRIQMSNGITIERGLVLNGDGISASGSLQNVSGTNTWSGNITNNSNARINANTNTALIISGNISNAASQSLFFGGDGNITNTGTITGNLTTGNGALYKDGAGRLTLTGNNTGLTGLVRVLGGTASIATANNIGSGTVEIGGSGTLATTADLTRTAGLTVTDASTGASIDVASGTTFTQTGAFTGTANSATKIGKSGNGTLIFNAASGSTFGGQIQIGQGTVVVGRDGALGNNTSTVNRGVDLGLNVGDVPQGNNVSLLASNGVTVEQSIWVEQNTSGAARTVGISGSGTATFTNEVRMNTGTTLTVQAGSSGTDRVNISGPITQNSGAASGIIKQGVGTLALSGANTYTGTTTINAGTLRLERLSGGVGATSVSGSTIAVNSGGTLLLGAANQIGDTTGITMSGGTLDTGASLADNVGQLRFSGSGVTATIRGLATGDNGSFIFSGMDTSSGANLANSGLTFAAASGQSYDFVNGFRIKLFSTDIASTLTSNSFSTKVSFEGASQVGAISFTGGTSATYLTVAAIPEPRVYAAAACLIVLIGVTEYRRRRRPRGI